MSKKVVYMIGCECNDKGWNMGLHSFSLAEDAVQYMRDYVAKFIRDVMASGAKVSNLRVCRDTVMLDAYEKSQTITFKVNDDFYDFRVWGIQFHTERIPASKVIHY